MKNVLSLGFRLTALASFGFWWVWFLGGISYYYLVEDTSLWSSVTSGAGLCLAVSVSGIFCAAFSDIISGES